MKNVVSGMESKNLEEDALQEDELLGWWFTMLTNLHLWIELQTCNISSWYNNGSNHEKSKVIWLIYVGVRHGTNLLLH